MPKKRIRAAVPRADGRAEVVVYIHGILNKPKPSVLKCQWDNALFGVDMGDRTRMAYWVNREYYPTPLEETCVNGDRLVIPTVHHDLARPLAFAEQETDGQWLARQLDELKPSGKERRTLERLGQRLLARTPDAQAGPRVRSVRAKVLPLPPPIRKWVTRFLTGALLRDVHDFLFDTKRRADMEASLRQRLDAGGGPFVVVAHSQGSMIAYDVLRQLSAKDYRVPLLLTVGSPLGLDEVQDVLRDWAGVRGRLPIPACVERWVNVADRLDPVAADCHLANDFTGRIGIEDECDIGLNPDWRDNPHSGTGYLRTEQARRPVAEAVGTQFAQPVRRFVIARDLVRNIENAGDQRHPVLIQLSGSKPGTDSKRSTETASLEAARKTILERLDEVVAAEAREHAEIDELRRFVSAKLTRFEVERLSSLSGRHIDFIWANARKHTLTWMSSQRIQAMPANRSFGASGTGINWAVLDTGIRADHPHFAEHENIVEQWDCTKRGEPKRGSAPDVDGHGTHVAGIIAGACNEKLKGERGKISPSGMAPEAKLHIYKVLGDDGEGQDSWIIKALDHVASVNEGAAELVIHGINLSLGGSFDPSVYGCGHSPLCAELRRLWQQGVLVCIAAGNDGYAVLQTEEGTIESNLDLSIGDPANLDEAIAVGSVHKESPHIYGVSYFSSRGPTADGRRKPDLVAPGERILSARHDCGAKRFAAGVDAERYYVEMSGTSMAAPHVSGGLAAFLSVRREFIGYPDKVKALLLENATDLKRDPYVQGTGLINVLQMLTST